MHRSRRRMRGAFLLEAICGLAVIGVTLYSVSMLVIAYERMQEHVFTQRRLQLAAEGQMERYRSGQPLPETTACLDVADGIRLRIERSPGSGDWVGLEHVRITATVTVRHGRRASYPLASYLEAQKP